MEDKLDKIADDIRDIKVDMIEIRSDLNHHIKRCDLLEEQLEPLRKAHIEFTGAIKFIKILGILVAIAEAIRMLSR